MARSVGIDAGDYAVKAVEVDGSYRKTRLLGYRIERLSGGPAESAARAAAFAAATGEAIRQAKMTGDRVLGHPCREAVLRTIEVPFRGEDNIRRVIKSEVENAIHSHAVDEMVVDFHTIEANDERTRVLVAAVPKPGLAAMLSALVAEGVEPEHVDLDTMALYRVADWCGAFQAPGAREDDEIALDEREDAVEAAETSLPAAAPAAEPVVGITVVIDLGARSTRVLLVDGGRLVDMRTLRIGDAVVVDAVARAHDLPFDVARDAVQACLASGADYQVEVAAALPVPVDGGEAAAPAAARRVMVGASAVADEQAAFVQRLSREFVRFLASSSIPQTVGAVWITGGASRLAGMVEMLRDVFGVTPRQLDVMAHVKHSLSPEEAETVGPKLAVAIGLALANLGGPVGFDLRREELAYTRGFDRIKSALAITCMVALFAAIVYAVKLGNELKNLEYRLGMTFEGPKANPKDPQFFGQLSPIVLSKFVREAAYFEFPDGNKKNYAYKDLVADLVAKPVAERVRFVRDKLRRALDIKQKESGIYEEVSLESGLAVLLRFFEVLKASEDGMGRYLLASLELNMRATPSQKFSGRWLQCRFAFRGSDFRERFAALRSAIEAECQRPGSPFEAIDERVGGDLPFRDGAEKGINGAYYDLKIHIREAFAAPTFGGGQ